MRFSVGRIRHLKDTIAGKIMLLLTGSAVLLVFVMAAGLFFRSWPILQTRPFFELIFSHAWKPLKGQFGFYPFIMGTLWVTVASLTFSLPFCLLTAVYLSEYAHKKVLVLMNPLIDVLAGIPSIVYGMWGVLVIVPFIRNHLAPFFGAVSTGYSVLAGGLVLAVMIIPVIIHVCVEVFKTVPSEMREASLSLGATRWQTVKHVVIRKSLPGIVAAFVLGFSRAFGETMAVMMVAGNVAKVPMNVFDPAYPLPALIANNYGEMLSVPLYDSALLLASLILMTVVVFFNVISRWMLVRLERKVR